MKKINYYLSENPLSTAASNSYMARIKPKETLNQNDLIKTMLGKNTTVTRQDIIVVLDLLKESVKDIVLDGYNLITDLFKTRVSIKGGFLSSEEPFDRQRHQVCVNLTMASDFKQDLANKAYVEAVDPGKDSPLIRQIWDYRTRAFRNNLSSGGLIRIKGAHMASMNVDTQVYLQPYGTEERIPVTQIHSATDRIILCNLPEDLTAGDYWLYVVLGEGDKALRGWYPQVVTIS